VCDFGTEKISDGSRSVDKHEFTLESLLNLKFQRDSNNFIEWHLNLAAMDI